MRTVQTIGVTAVAVALLLWVVAGVLMATTGTGEGVNLGAVLLAMVAVVTSVGAAVLLIISASGAVVRGLAIASLVAWAVVLAMTPEDSSEAAPQVVAAAVGLAALCACAVLAWRGRTRTR